jgi:hypothetical protein
MFSFNLALLAERMSDPVVQYIGLGFLAAIAIIVIISLFK